VTVPRFLLDEHVWHGLIQVAKEAGTDALPAQAVLPEGTNDEEVLAFAASQGRILLTSNANHFAHLAKQWFFAGREHYGIIILPGQTDKRLFSRALKIIIQHQSAESFKNSYRFVQEFV
jgi:hypothetical protein